jgi:hypothetical protein
MMLFHHSATAFTTAIWVARSTPMARRSRSRMRIRFREEEERAREVGGAGRVGEEERKYWRRRKRRRRRRES